MDEILGKYFYKSNGMRVELATLKSVRIICVYFSGQWCPPCRAFSPMLELFYKEINSTIQNLEIIYCSKDQNEKAYIFCKKQ
jgi:nucleoredoxin